MGSSLPPHMGYGIAWKVVLLANYYLCSFTSFILCDVSRTLLISDREPKKYGNPIKFCFEVCIDIHIVLGHADICGIIHFVIVVFLDSNNTSNGCLLVEVFLSRRLDSSLHQCIYKNL